MRGLIRLLREKLLPGESVRDQAVKGGFWLFAVRGFGRSLHLIKLAVLARLLAPADFGLMGIALLALSVLQQFSKLGLNTALVQREESNIDSYLDTAWVMKITRGLLIGTVAFLSAPLFASFFGDPRITDLVRALAILPIIRGFTNPGIVYFKKDLEFHKKFAYDTSGNLVNFTAAVGFALVYPSVWALVVGNLVEGLTKLGVSYLVHRYRPSVQIDLSKARELLGYGKWITLSVAVLFLLNQGDDAFVGWYLGATALGFYQMAFRFGNAPTTEISNVVASVLLPTYSKVQNDLNRLQSMFNRSLELITFVSFPAAVGIAVIAPLFVPTVLGGKWTPLIEELQILTIWGMFRSLSAVFRNLFQAMGRPDVNTKIEASRLILLAVVIMPATARFGTEGTAIAVTIPAVLGIMVSGYVSTKFVKIPFRSLLTQVSYPLTSALVMGTVVYQAQRRLVIESGAVELIGLILLGVVVQLSVTWLLTRISSYNIWSTFSVVVGSVR